MIHVTLAIGILLGGILYGVAIKLFQSTNMQTFEIHQLLQYSYASYIPAFIIAYVIIKITSLKSRLPNKIPAYPALVIGVWLALIKISISASYTFKVWVSISIATLPASEEITKYIISPVIPFSGYISSSLILYSLFVILLQASPNSEE